MIKNFGYAFFIFLTFYFSLLYSNLLLWHLHIYIDAQELNLKKRELSLLLFHGVDIYEVVHPWKKLFHGSDIPCITHSDKNGAKIMLSLYLHEANEAYTLPTAHVLH